MGDKKPVSVLVLVHSADHRILLLERVLHPGYWQSVTGSLENGETPRAAARRELAEETGIAAAPESLRDWGLSNRFEIFAEWRDRYAEGVTRNIEHVFSLALPEPSPVTLSPGEHRDYRWLPWPAAAEAVFSWTNRDAIVLLGRGHLQVF